MSADRRATDVSDDLHDRAWPSSATEIGLLTVLGETVGAAVTTIAFALSVMVLVLDLIRIVWG